jgi:hypothetical protein
MEVYMVSFKNRLIVVSLVASALLYSPFSHAESFLPDVRMRGDISYITGGVGDEETEAMKSERGDYNLHIMNSDANGHFAGTRNILISDAKGNELLDADSGPLFYANLPKGRYIVEASSNSETKRKKVNITGNKPANVHFVWK